MITKRERAQISQDAALGAGNVIHRLKAYGRPLDEQVLWTDATWRAPDGSHPEVLTLGELHETVETYASWYHARGVRPRDPVAIQTYSSTEFAINYLALTSLGAIPSFVNGNLRPETARAYVRRQGAVGALTDQAHHSVLAPDRAELGLGFCATAADITAAARGPLPAGYPYAHHATDPVIISHSSGTTGMPKAVPHTHETLLYAQLHRLKLSVGSAMGRLLVALPGSHNAAVSVMMFGFLLRSPVLMLSSQRGDDVLDAMESFRPTTVFAFAGTYGEMAARDLAARDLSSVEAWYNTGDAAHESHIRALIALGSHETVGRDLKRCRVPGSVFTDGLGSSETGYSLFHNGHRPGRSSFSRCVGKPMSFAEAAVLSEDGTPLPPGEVGRLGVRSPTLTPGYWNDSLTFHRLRLGGYWLTGDLSYRDEEGKFYHLDRAPDAIRTREGIVFSTRTEELLLRELPELEDCTVVAVTPEGVRADWDGDGTADAYVLLQVRAGAAAADDAHWTARVGQVLSAAGFPPLTGALRMDAGDVVKGATGKVLKREMRRRFRARVADGELTGKAR
ncbi:class I adenylate-forming enzyme family protein [Streptomyces sp. SRF1]|uniref:class I adenylate-forming enzyme family protein n=1 Tax=Streptomyces sp. SRF1 TaxID=1549642 RepID=UPI0025B0468B|nr:class I adenylate-forming enzyme family protein [Streptomyces sp. SRF1]MDN3057995.1 class I adenylate-forming enzyme family protein [Streptomyces sp. SRF1]